jgi:hypothetical protein
MLKQTVLVSFLHLGILLTAATNSYSDMMPCPSFKSQTSYDINKVCYKKCNVTYIHKLIIHTLFFAVTISFTSLCVSYLSEEN